jgi:molybdate transport system regulatory protein
MKISARNAFDGSVQSVKPGAINSEVDIALPGGLQIVATVTNDSVSNSGWSPARPSRLW